ncbi:MAG: guanylate kinase [Desulfovibrio sp.]|nr:guanylate kinase [Desulfovibrio sp.]
MTRQGIALVLSAPSGAGKSTLQRRLRSEFPNFAYSISCTTRPPRGQEQEGVDYYFLTKQDFLAKRDANFFAEWAEVHGNFYGTPLQPVLSILSQGQDLLFDIDVQGAAKLRKSLEAAFFIFILPPSMAELEKRLRLRGTDSEDTIQMRLRNAKVEVEAAYDYDALIINDDLNQAYAELKACYMAATLVPARRKNFLQTFCEQI